MAERNIGRPWTEHEDQLLTQAVSVHGENDNWKTIALCIPGRTNKACRKRWLHSLSPSVKKSAWTRQEDELLLSLYAVHSTRWAVIARHIQGRTDDACSKRYREALDPALKKTDWTPDEDMHLLQAYLRLGGKWGQIGTELSRSGLGCRNRWRLLDRKRTQKTHDPNCCGPQPISATWPNTLWDHDGSHSSTPLCIPESGDIDMDLTRPPTPPPFQFSSSSLISALSNPESGNGANPVVVQELSEPPTESDPGCCDAEPCCNAEACCPPQSDFCEPDHQPSIHEPPPIKYPLPTREEYCRGCPLNWSDPPSTSSSTPTQIFTQDTEEITEKPDNLPEVDEESQSESAPARPARSKKRSKASANPRLSSLLPVDSDKTVFAYVCGHMNCWPDDAIPGSVQFSTSKELWDHSKNDHSESMGGSKPFRCGLEGCGKGWKSINGLQYHLQVSKAHFKQALLTQFPPQVASLPAALDIVGKDAKPRKKFACPHDGCPNEYLQKSGLRYHLSHGHPSIGPTQLSVLPPVLAEKMNKSVDLAQEDL